MGKKILIVDNSTLLLAQMSELVKSNIHDIDIITADNGIEVCKKAVQLQPDLILMDWDIPEMGGFEVLINLKQHEFTKDIPIIILSASKNLDDVKKAFDAGAIYYLPKPIDDTEVLARIHSALTLYGQIKDLKAERNRLMVSNHKNNFILRSILPRPILKQIKQYGSVPPKRYRNKVVIFVDMVDFTKKSSSMSPGTLLRELQTTFKNFDEVIEKHHCTRIKTIGDAYMAVCGLFCEVEDIELEAARAAIKIRKAIMERNLTNQIEWEVKIGMYSGDVICSSVSTTNLSFDIFGETVNMASRLQQACEPMQINISQDMSKKLKHKYKLIERTAKKVKGKGVIPMYYIHRPLPKNKAAQRDTCSDSTPLYALN